MIITSVLGALKAIVSKPALLIAVLVSIIFGKILAQLTIDAWIPIADVFTMWYSPTESPLIALILSNPLEIFIILLAAIISFTVSVIVLEFLARIMRDEGVMEAVNDSVLDWKKAFGVAFTIGMVVSILMLLMLFSVEFGRVNELISLALVLIMAVFSFFAFVKTIFIFPAMVTEKNAKHAFQKSWAFAETYLSFGKIVLFLFVLGAIIYVFDLGVLSVVTILLQAGIDNEILIMYAIPVIEDMFVTSFVGLAIAGYFYSK